MIDDFARTLLVEPSSRMAEVRVRLGLSEDEMVRVGSFSSAYKKAMTIDSLCTQVTGGRLDLEDVPDLVRIGLFPKIPLTIKATGRKLDYLDIYSRLPLEEATMNEALRRQPKRQEIPVAFQRRKG